MYTNTLPNLINLKQTRSTQIEFESTVFWETYVINLECEECHLLVEVTYLCNSYWHLMFSELILICDFGTEFWQDLLNISVLIIHKTAVVGNFVNFNFILPDYKTFISGNESFLISCEDVIFTNVAHNSVTWSSTILWLFHFSCSQEPI